MDTSTGHNYSTNAYEDHPLSLVLISSSPIFHSASRFTALSARPFVSAIVRLDADESRPLARVISYRSRPSISPGLHPVLNSGLLPTATTALNYHLRAPDQKRKRTQSTRESIEDLERRNFSKSKEDIAFARFSRREALCRLASKPWEAALPDLNHTIFQE